MVSIFYPETFFIGSLIYRSPKAQKNGSKDKNTRGGPSVQGCIAGFELIVLKTQLIHVNYLVYDKRCLLM
jgi:hypothetical protein